MPSFIFDLVCVIQSIELENKRIINNLNEQILGSIYKNEDYLDNFNSFNSRSNHNNHIDITTNKISNNIYRKSNIYTKLSENNCNIVLILMN